MFEGLLAPTHVLIIVIIALFVFGPQRLPELARSVGNGMRTFKDEITPPDRDRSKDDASSSDRD